VCSKDYNYSDQGYVSEISLHALLLEGWKEGWRDGGVPLPFFHPSILPFKKCQPIFSGI
jgi:hypothetical protein